MTLIGSFPLTEDSGSTAYDYSGNDNDGTANGAGPSGTGTVSGPLGTTAYDFDGSDDDVDCNDSIINNQISGSWSVSQWFNLNSFSDGSMGITSEYTGNGEETYTFFYNASAGNFQFVFAQSSDGTSIRAKAPDSNYSPGSWIHGVQVWDSGGDIYLYLNGAEAGTATHDGTIESTTTNFLIGQYSSNYTSGSINDVRIYDHALTASEVQYLYNVTQEQKITTATKTHSSAVKPDLKTNITLNNETATAYVTGSPDTGSEETVSTSLSDGTNTSTLTWSNTHSDFRILVTTNISTITNRVEITNLELRA